MTYVNGCVMAVPTENKEAYRASAEKAWPLFREYGALSVMENRGDNVPEGKQTDH